MTATDQLYRRTLSADCVTPPAVFARLTHRSDCFLFESADGGEQWGRYSILGIAPACRAVEENGKTMLHHRDGTCAVHEKGMLDWLRIHVINQEYLPVDDLPFAGGAVGYFGYQWVSNFEDIPADLPDSVGAPDSAFLLVDRFMVFDNLRGTLTCCVRMPKARGAEAEEVLDRMQASLYEGEPASTMHLDADLSQIAIPKAQMLQTDYEAAVKRAREYIHAGDIFQVVLSQRFGKKLACDKFDIYRAVRHINPSPYLFYLHIGDTALIGSSPEILVRRKENRAVVRPIAGTRPRGATLEEDQSLEKELLADAKERAEHIMLVDLGRNDLGRVCKYGSVEVTDLMAVEYYSHVMHIVSQVEGELRDDVDALDLLAATFPAGTVSGAPKVRAMEIINELEPVARGPYAGTIGHIGFGGQRMDTAIAIRTAVVHDGHVYVQAGAGIVADSVPESEYAECKNKAQAMFRAVALAEAQPEKAGDGT